MGNKGRGFLKNVILVVITSLISSTLVLSLATDKQDNGQFLVYDAKIVEASIYTTLRKKHAEYPDIYSRILRNKMKALDSFLIEKSKEKPLYAYGARVGGVEITDEILTFLKVDRYEEVIMGEDNLKMPSVKAIEEAKKELLERLQININNSKSLIP